MDRNSKLIQNNPLCGKYVLLFIESKKDDDFYGLYVLDVRF